MPDVYLVEEMDSHLFQVVLNTGEVLEKIDLLAAEAMLYQCKRSNKKVEVLERGAIKERKHVRNLVAQYKVSHPRQSHLYPTCV